MIRRLTVRMVPLTNRAADYAPLAPACCNVCRTCTMQNIVGVVLGAATALGLGIAGAVKRFARPS